MIVVAVGAYHYVGILASHVEWLAVILLDWICLDEVPQRSKLSAWISGCAAAAGVDQNDDRVIDLGVYEGKLPVLVSLDYAKRGGIQPGAGEACGWAAVAVAVFVLGRRDHGRAGGR